MGSELMREVVTPSGGIVYTGAKLHASPASPQCSEADVSAQSVAGFHYTARSLAGTNFTAYKN